MLGWAAYRERLTMHFFLPYALNSFTFDTISSSVLAEIGNSSHLNFNLTIIKRSPFWSFCHCTFWFHQERSLWHYY